MYQQVIIDLKFCINFVSIGPMMKIILTFKTLKCFHMFYFFQLLSKAFTKNLYMSVSTNISANFIEINGNSFKSASREFTMACKKTGQTNVLIVLSKFFPVPFLIVTSPFSDKKKSENSGLCHDRVHSVHFDERNFSPIYK